MLLCAPWLETNCTDLRARSDGWSMGILGAELAAMYNALKAGRPPPELPPLAVQYADFAAWQRARLDGGELEAQV